MVKDLFSSIDLNLLRTFLVISQELNTRKAAERLFVSQPAISQSLRKLRDQLGDELFVKAPNGLKATPFAEELARKITPYLNGLSATINQSQVFDPSQLSVTLKIAVAPIVLSCLSSSLFQHLAEVAPHCTLELLAWKDTSIASIQSDELMLGISINHQVMQNVLCEPLVDLEARIIVRKQHPIQTETVSPHEMEPYPIASIINPGWNENFTLAAEIMKLEGLNPVIGFRSEFVMAVVDVIEHTDYFMPHSNLFPIRRYPHLRAITPLIDGAPYHTYLNAFYHSKYKGTDFIDWLIAQIKWVIAREMPENTEV